MAFAPPIKAKISSNLAKSTWTPMNHPEANLQVFEERRELIKKWKWQDAQKRVIVDDILKNLSSKHLVALNETLNAKFPQERHDFTRILPRVLTLYLFSFLDPRSLCRCAQVSWYWNYLSEMDCLWRPKCLKFGWYPTYQPSPFEERVWKRFYVSTVHELNFAKVKSIEQKAAVEQSRPNTARSTMSKASVAMSTTSSITGLKKGPTVPSTKKPLSAPKWQPPPWKGSDPHPVDTMRYNYLDNMGGDKKRSPGQRPSSRQSGRPHSAAGRSRHHKTEIDSKHSLEETRESYNPPMDKTSRLSGSTLAAYAGTVPSPRLNKDFQLPQYNGNDVSSNANSTLKYAPGSTITSQINWNPQTSRNSHDPMRSQHSYERPSSSHGRISSQAGKSAQAASDEFARMSMGDAGVRPQPVAKYTPEKIKRSKDGAAEQVTSPTTKDQAKTTTNSKDLQGKGWAAPANSNSDDEF